ncbi:MAG: transporter [Bacteroidota bacterium]
MKNFQWIPILFICYLQPSMGQETSITPSDRLNELTVDRPGIADMPFTVAPRTYQLETGFEYYAKTNGSIMFLPVTMLRTGLSKAAELRVSVRNIHEKRGGTDIRGISPLTIGIKTHIIEQRGWIPETDILADVIFKLGNSPLQPDYTGHDILLLFQNDLSNKVAINYNTGFIWDGFTNQEMFTASFCFNYLPVERLGLFAEYFDYIRKTGTEEHGIDGGLTWLLTPMIQADLSAGVSLINGRFNHFVAGGISFRAGKGK